MLKCFATIRVTSRIRNRPLEVKELILSWLTSVPNVPSLLLLNNRKQIEEHQVACPGYWLWLLWWVSSILLFFPINGLAPFETVYIHWSDFCLFKRVFCSLSSLCENECCLNSFKVLPCLCFSLCLDTSSNRLVSSLCSNPFGMLHTSKSSALSLLFPPK